MTYPNQTPLSVFRSFCLFVFLSFCLSVFASLCLLSLSLFIFVHLSSSWRSHQKKSYFLGLFPKNFQAGLGIVQCCNIVPSLVSSSAESRDSGLYCAPQLSRGFHNFYGAGRGTPPSPQWQCVAGRGTPPCLAGRGIHPWFMRVFL